MKRLSVGTILCLIMVCGLVAQQAFKLIPPDRSFEVSFPGEPKHDRSESDSGPFHIEQHVYTFENSTAKFSLSYLDLTPTPTDLSPADALDGAIRGTVENVSGRLLETKPLTIQGKTAKAVTISAGETTIIDGRFVYMKPRVYQLVVLHRRGAKPAFEQQFFDSFKLLHSSREEAPLSAPRPSGPPVGTKNAGTPNAAMSDRGVVQGELIYRVNPVYPASAQEKKIEGTVQLQATVGKDGLLRNVRAIDGPPELFEAAMEAVKQWRYRPYTLNNEPVEVMTKINVTFQLPR